MEKRALFPYCWICVWRAMVVVVVFVLQIFNTSLVMMVILWISIDLREEVNHTRSSRVLEEEYEKRIS